MVSCALMEIFISLFSSSDNHKTVSLRAAKANELCWVFMPLFSICGRAIEGVVAPVCFVYCTGGRVTRI